MNQRVAGKTLVSATHEAIFELLSQVGHHVHYGAAVFPNPNAGDCSAGLEVFRTTLGDPPYSGGRPGLSLSRLMSSLESAPVRGGTPISPTLDLLTPTLTALPGRTYVILATDGGPNCNSEATCDGDGCQLNLEGASFGSQRCDHRLNCCDPALFQGAQLNCLDDAKTLASIATLRARGIDTFVIGMPGSELYESTLARLAVAGGRPLPRAPRYYSAGTPEALRDALLDIGLAVAISCRITLDEPPKDPALVNLYFDNQLVPSDPDDGWVWRGDDEIELTGARCQRLQSGKVTNVQIVSGCPTEVK